MSQYSFIPTAAGLARQVNLALQGKSIAFTHMAFGDGDHADLELQSLTELVDEQARFPISDIKPVPDDPQSFILECVFPGTIGGFYVREAGLFDEDGVLCYIAAYTGFYKPVSADGAVEDLIVNAYITVSRDAVVSMSVDPNVATASRRWVNEELELGVSKLRARKAANAERLVELANTETEDLDVGDMEGRQYVYNPDAEGEDSITDDLGINYLTPLDVVTPEHAASLERAVLYACQQGRGFVITKGQTYTVNTPIKITDMAANIDLDGGFIVRGPGMPDNAPLIEIEHSFDVATYGDAPEVTEMVPAEHDYGNGPIFVPRLTLTDVTPYQVGQKVRVMSSDRIPSIAPWTDMRVCADGEIGHIEGNYLYLLRPFARTPVGGLRLAVFSEYPVRIRGGDLRDIDGYPVTRNATMVQLTGVVEPDVSDLTTRHTASTAINFKACYGGAHTDCVHIDARHDPDANGAYGYGAKFSGGTSRLVSSGARGRDVRHLLDTGGKNRTDAELNNTAPYDFSGCDEIEFVNFHDFDSLKSSASLHPDGFQCVIRDGSLKWSNRRSDNAALFGVEDRGQETKIIGGTYEAIVPVRLQPSTDRPILLKDIVTSKPASNIADAARGPAFDIEGGDIVSGAQAVVHIEGAHLSASGGKKELFCANNAVVHLEMSAHYEATDTHPVIGRLKGASKVFVHGLKADFTRSDAASHTFTLFTQEGPDCDIRAPGRVTVLTPDGYDQTVILVNFKDGEGRAEFEDVYVDCDLFTQSGFRHQGDPTNVIMGANIHRIDGAYGPNIVNYIFTGGGAKNITWPEGRREDNIYLRVKPVDSDTSLGSIPKGGKLGQMLFVTNFGTTHNFEISSSITNIAVSNTRFIETGETTSYLWDGGNWTG